MVLNKPKARVRKSGAVYDVRSINFRTGDVELELAEPNGDTYPELFGADEIILLVDGVSGWRWDSGMFEAQNEQPQTKETKCMKKAPV